MTNLIGIDPYVIRNNDSLKISPEEREKFDNHDFSQWLLIIETLIKSKTAIIISPEALGFLEDKSQKIETWKDVNDVLNLKARVFSSKWDDITNKVLYWWQQTLINLKNIWINTFISDDSPDSITTTLLKNCWINVESSNYILHSINFYTFIPNNPLI